MARRSPLALPLIGAALALGVGTIASWILSDGGGGAAAVSMVDSPGASAAQELADAEPGHDEPASVTDPEPELADAAEARVEPAELTSEARISLAETELEAAHWVEGRVLFPADTPPDEVVEIVAAGKQFENRDPYRAKVAADGSFRVAFSEHTRYGWLKLDAPHLHLEESEKIKISSIPDEIVLEPKLGGRIRGVVIPPPGVTDARAKPKDDQVRIHCWSGTNHEGVQRTGKVGQDMRFDLRGVPAGQSYVLEYDAGNWAPVEQEDLQLAAGQTQDIELRPSLGARVAVRVIDETAAAVRDARVIVRIERKSRGMISRESRRAERGRDGTYAIEGIAPSQATLVASKEGFADAELDLGEVVDGEVREGLELRLSLGHSFAGRVVWPDGTPAPGASLRVEEESQPVTWMGTRDGSAPGSHESASASDGSFLVTGLGPGPYTISASAAKVIAPEPAAEGEKRPNSTKKGPPWHVEFEHVRASESPLVLTLQPGLAVTGRVVDDTGTGVNRFTVSATKIEGTGPQLSYSGSGPSNRFESEDGSFVFEGLPEGRWQLCVRAKGFVEGFASNITLPGNGQGLTILLARAATLSGTVVDPAGQPVEKAKVLAEFDSPEFLRYSSWDGDVEHVDSTDDLGRFEIDDAPIGKLLMVASHDGFVSSEPLSVEVVPAGTLDALVLRLRRGGRLTGELRSSAGERADGRGISLHFRDGGEWRETSTDATGEFAIENLVPGIYQVTAEPSEQELIALGGGEDEDQDEPSWMGRTALEESAAVSIADGETTHVVLGGPPRAPVQVSGTVRCGRKPVEGARIRTWKHSSTGQLQQRFAKTDADGSYELTLDEPGSYSFTLTSPSSWTQVSRHESIPEVSSHTLDFELPSGQISGRVLGPDGAPLEGIHVSIRIDSTEAEKRSDGIYGWSESDAEGRFAFLDLPPGSYTVSTRDGNFSAQVRYGSVEETGLVLKEGAHIAGLSLELDDAATLEGIVRTVSGTPAGGATITVWNGRGQPDGTWSVKATDKTGRYSVSGLAPGSWSVSARLHSEVAEASPPVLLEPG